MLVLLAGASSNVQNAVETATETAQAAAQHMQEGRLKENALIVPGIKAAASPAAAWFWRENGKKAARKSYVRHWRKSRENLFLCREEAARIFYAAIKWRENGENLCAQPRRTTGVLIRPATNRTRALVAQW